MATEMKRSYLVQRLRKPRGWELTKDNPFSFGGGLQNGGLSGDAMSLLRPIMAFDYMGAAEFEFGAVPEALSGIAKDAKRLRAFDFDIALADVAQNWQDKSRKAPEGSATVYVLARKEHTAEAEVRIRGWAAKDYVGLKEPTNLPNTLRPFTEWDGETVGWLELSNGFFFFTDREMWEQTAALFGVKVEAVSA